LIESSREEDLVAVHLDDGAVDDVAVVEVLDRRVDGGEEVLFGTDVVDRHLGRVVIGKSGDGARHKGGCSLDGWSRAGTPRIGFH
jgi:hypothetical protein